MYCALWRRLFDAGLVALESISPGKCIYYGTLRCHTLPSKENFPRQRPAPWFLRQIFLSPVRCRTFFPPRRLTGTSGYHFEYNLHLIKIPSHVNREITYSADSLRASALHAGGGNSPFSHPPPYWAQPIFKSYLCHCCSYFERPTGNYALVHHGQAEEGVLGAVSDFVSICFISLCLFWLATYLVLRMNTWSHI